jgi:hypothetical protein
MIASSIQKMRGFALLPFPLQHHYLFAANVSNLSFLDLRIFVRTDYLFYDDVNSCFLFS